MAIPESQLETWSHQGSVSQSAGTYATIKNALESADAKYTNRDFEVFLQGSYGNATLKDLFTRLPAAKITQIKQFMPSAWAKAGGNLPAEKNLP
jgi:hypothetical protein